MSWEWKIYILGHPQIPRVHEAKQIWAVYAYDKIRQDKAKLTLSKLTSVFVHLPSGVSPKQLCALAHLGCTAKQVFPSS